MTYDEISHLLDNPAEGRNIDSIHIDEMSITEDTLTFSQKTMFYDRSGELVKDLAERNEIRIDLNNGTFVGNGKEEGFLNRSWRRPGKVNPEYLNNDGSVNLDELLRAEWPDTSFKPNLQAALENGGNSRIEITRYKDGSVYTDSNGKSQFSTPDGKDIYKLEDGTIREYDNRSGQVVDRTADGTVHEMSPEEFQRQRIWEAQDKHWAQREAAGTAEADAVSDEMRMEKNMRTQADHWRELEKMHEDGLITDQEYKTYADNISNRVYENDPRSMNEIFSADKAQEVWEAKQQEALKEQRLSEIHENYTEPQMEKLDEQRAELKEMLGNGEITQEEYGHHMNTVNKNVFEDVDQMREYVSTHPVTPESPSVETSDTSASTEGAPVKEPLEADVDDHYHADTETVQIDENTSYSRTEMNGTSGEAREHRQNLRDELSELRDNGTIDADEYGSRMNDINHGRYDGFENLNEAMEDIPTPTTEQEMAAPEVSPVEPHVESHTEVFHEDGITVEHTSTQMNGYDKRGAMHDELDRKLEAGEITAEQRAELGAKVNKGSFDRYGSIDEAMQAGHDQATGYQAETVVQDSPAPEPHIEDTTMETVDLGNGTTATEVSGTIHGGSEMTSERQAQMDELNAQLKNGEINGSEYQSQKKRMEASWRSEDAREAAEGQDSLDTESTAAESSMPNEDKLDMEAPANETSMPEQPIEGTQTKADISSTADTMDVKAPEAPAMESPAPQFDFSSKEILNSKTISLDNGMSGQISIHMDGSQSIRMDSYGTAVNPRMNAAERMKAMNDAKAQFMESPEVKEAISEQQKAYEGFRNEFGGQSAKPDIKAPEAETPVEEPISAEPHVENANIENISLGDGTEFTRVSGTIHGGPEITPEREAEGKALLDELQSEGMDPAEYQIETQKLRTRWAQEDIAKEASGQAVETPAAQAGEPIGPQYEITDKFNPQTVHVETPDGMSGEFRISSDGSITIESDSIQGLDGLSDSDKIAAFRSDPAVQDAILRARADGTVMQYRGGDFEFIRNIEVHTPDGLQDMKMVMDMDGGTKLYAQTPNGSYTELPENVQKQMMGTPDMQTVNEQLNDCRQAVIEQNVQIKEKLNNLEGLDPEVETALKDIRTEGFMPSEPDISAYIREPMPISDVLEAGDAVLATPGPELTEGLNALGQTSPDQVNLLVQFLTSPAGQVIAGIAIASMLIALVATIANHFSKDKNGSLMNETAKEREDKDAEFERINGGSIEKEEMEKSQPREDISKDKEKPAADPEKNTDERLQDENDKKKEQEDEIREPIEEKPEIKEETSPSKDQEPTPDDKKEEEKPEEAKEELSEDMDQPKEAKEHEDAPEVQEAKPEEEKAPSVDKEEKEESEKKTDSEEHAQEEMDPSIPADSTEEPSMDGNPESTSVDEESAPVNEETAPAMEESIWIPEMEQGMPEEPEMAVPEETADHAAGEPNEEEEKAGDIRDPETLQNMLEKETAELLREVEEAEKETSELLQNIEKARKEALEEEEKEAENTEKTVFREEAISEEDKTADDERKTIEEEPRIEEKQEKTTDTDPEQEKSDSIDFPQDGSEPVISTEEVSNENTPPAVEDTVKTEIPFAAVDPAEEKDRKEEPEQKTEDKDIHEETDSIDQEHGDDDAPEQDAIIPEAEQQATEEGRGDGTEINPERVAEGAKIAAAEAVPNEKMHSGVISWEVDRYSGSIILEGDISAKGIQRVLEAAEKYAAENDIRLSNLVIGKGTENIDINAFALVDRDAENRKYAQIDTVSFEADRKAYESLEKSKANALIMPESVKNLYFERYAPKACLSLNKDGTFRDYNIVAFRDVPEIVENFMPYSRINMLLENDTIPGHSMKIGANSFGNKKEFIGNYIKARDLEDEKAQEDPNKLTRKQKLEKDSEPVKHMTNNRMSCWSSFSKEENEKTIDSMTRMMNRELDADIKAMEEARRTLISEREAFIRDVRNTPDYVTSVFRSSDLYKEMFSAAKDELEKDYGLNGVKGTGKANESFYAKEYKALQNLAARLKDDKTKVGEKALEKINKYLSLGIDKDGNEDIKKYIDFRIKERKDAFTKIENEYLDSKVVYDYLQSDAGKARLSVCDHPEAFREYKELSAAIDLLSRDIEELSSKRSELLSENDRKIVQEARASKETVNGLRISEAGESAFENRSQRLLVSEDMMKLADTYLQVAEAETDPYKKEAFQNAAKDIMRGKVFVAANGMKAGSFSFANNDLEGLIQDTGNHISLTKEIASFEHDMADLNGRLNQLRKEGKDTTQIEKDIKEKKAIFDGKLKALVGPNASSISVLLSNSFASNRKLATVALISPSQTESIIRNSATGCPDKCAITFLTEEAKKMNITDLDQEKKRYEHDVRREDGKLASMAKSVSMIGSVFDKEYKLSQAFKDTLSGVLVIFAKIADMIKEYRENNPNTKLDGTKFGFFENVQEYYHRKFPNMPMANMDRKMLKEMGLAREAIASMAVLDIAMPGATDTEKAKSIIPVLNKMGEPVGTMIPVNGQLQEMKRKLVNSTYDVDTIIEKSKENRNGNLSRDEKISNYMNGLKEKVDTFKEDTNTPGKNRFAGLSEKVTDAADRNLNAAKETAEKRAEQYEKVKARETGKKDQHKSRYSSPDGRKNKIKPRRTDAARLKATGTAQKRKKDNGQEVDR